MRTNDADKKRVGSDEDDDGPDDRYTKPTGVVRAVLVKNCYFELAPAK